MCERCAVNEIYMNESYDKVVDKVWTKVTNILKLRTKANSLMQNKMLQQHPLFNQE